MSPLGSQFLKVFANHPSITLHFFTTLHAASIILASPFTPLPHCMQPQSSLHHPSLLYHTACSLNHPCITLHFFTTLHAASIILASPFTSLPHCMQPQSSLHHPSLLYHTACSLNHPCITLHSFTFHTACSLCYFLIPRLKEPKAVLQFTTDNQSKQQISFTFEQLVSFYAELEKIQSKLDNLAS